MSDVTNDLVRYWMIPWDVDITPENLLTYDLVTKLLLIIITQRLIRWSGTCRISVAVAPYQKSY